MSETLQATATHHAAKTCLFLAPEWVYEVTRVLQSAQLRDKQFGELASGFSLILAYQITDIPPQLKERYNGEPLVILVQLDKGKVRHLAIGTEPPQEFDFLLISTYEVAKKIFVGELNAATAFVNRQFKIEPLSRVYSNPRFTAKSIVTGNLLLKFARQVPTIFPDGEN